METAHKHVASSLRRAWEQKDMELLRSLLADTLAWREGPDAEVLHTPDAVIKTWEHDLAKQKHIHAGIKLMDCVEERGYYSCTASWCDHKDTMHGGCAVFVVKLNHDQKISSFTMYWVEMPKG